MYCTKLSWKFVVYSSSLIINISFRETVSAQKVLGKNTKNDGEAENESNEKERKDEDEERADEEDEKDVSCENFNYYLFL